MSNPRTKRNRKNKAVRIILSSFFHVVFLGILVFAFAVSLDEDRMFDLALDSIKLIEQVKYVVGGLLGLYVVVISLHFAEILIEVRQTRKSHDLVMEVQELKAKIFDLTREEEERDEKIQAFKDSLDND
ncbi:MAG TPA: hypothetical protein DCE41_22125 [Cytophagales bacterium]|nr:hypothetical protein [Cytophagales bacterium]HAA24415.1 hypothetical protein [Cytophagales bacterium]HAP59684.1 hypothetical protein [Cytophagales bacterium]